MNIIVLWIYTLYTHLSNTKFGAIMNEFEYTGSRIKNLVLIPYVPSKHMVYKPHLTYLVAISCTYGLFTTFQLLFVSSALTTFLHCRLFSKKINIY